MFRIPCHAQDTAKDANSINNVRIVSVYIENNGYCANSTIECKNVLCVNAPKWPRLSPLCNISQAKESRKGGDKIPLMIP